MERERETDESRVHVCEGNDLTLLRRSLASGSRDGDVLPPFQMEKERAMSFIEAGQGTTILCSRRVLSLTLDVPFLLLFSLVHLSHTHTSLLLIPVLIHILFSLVTEEIIVHGGGPHSSVSRIPTTSKSEVIFGILLFFLALIFSVTVPPPISENNKQKLASDQNSEDTLLSKSKHKVENESVSSLYEKMPRESDVRGEKSDVLVLLIHPRFLLRFFKRSQLNEGNDEMEERMTGRK